MFQASRFTLPAALSLSVSSLAVSAAMADGPSTPPQPALLAGEVAKAIVRPDPHLKAWRDLVPPSLGERFTLRLEREAQGHMDLAAVPPASTAPALDTTAALPGDGGSDRRVKRMLTRALRGVLDEEFATFTQNAPFTNLLRRDSARGDVSGVRAHAAPLDEAATGAPPGAIRRGPGAERLDASFGVRLDAHPRLQLRTRLGSFSGVVEVPLLDPELRVGLERPLGTAGRAALRAGTGGDRGDWATLNFAFGF